MAEKRKPILVMLLRFRGKSYKLEWFRAKHWPEPEFFANAPRLGGGSGHKSWLRRRFRIRYEGKWFTQNGMEPGQPAAYTMYQVRDILFRSLRGVLNNHSKDQPVATKRTKTDDRSDSEEL